MSADQPIHFVKQFVRGIDHLAQQKFSRFRPAVRMVPHEVGEEAFIDQIGTVTPVESTSRHADTPLTDTPQLRRQVGLKNYKHADLIDKADMIRTLNDPTNDFLRSFARGFARVIDDNCIGAAFATAKTGKTGSGSAAFDTTGFRITSGSTPMTLAKILRANEILRAAENDPEEGFFFAVSQRQLRDMLTDTTIGSSDYNSVKTLMAGTVKQFMGFEWIPSERLGVTSSERRCIAWAKNSIGLMIGKEPAGRISERGDKSYATQAFMEMDIGASRLDETGVVEVLCTEP